MGRKTYEAIPEKFRPLKGRLNVVLTSDPETFMEKVPESQKENVLAYDNYEVCLEELSKNDQVREIVNIGGAQLIEQSLKNPEQIKYILQTRVSGKFGSDVFMPELDKSVFKPIHISKTYVDNEIPYDMVIYGNMEVLERNPEFIPNKLIKDLPKHEEMQYLEKI